VRRGRQQVDEGNRDGDTIIKSKEAFSTAATALATRSKSKGNEADDKTTKATVTA